MTQNISLEDFQAIYDRMNDTYAIFPDLINHESNDNSHELQKRPNLSNSAKHAKPQKKKKRN